MIAHSQDRRRGVRRWLVLLVLFAVPVGAAAAAQQPAQPASPATGHARVVAQAVVAFPDERVAWRLVERTARPRGEAEPGVRVLGFVLAGAAPILLTDETETGPVDVARLAPGEVALVREGTRQTRASLSSEAVAYLVLEVVAAEDVADVGSGRLIQASDPFDAPTGLRDFDMLLDIIVRGEQTLVPDTGEATLVCVAAGSVDVQGPAGAPTRLDTLEFALFPDGGEVTVEPAADAAVAGFVVATIGPSVLPGS